MGSATGAVASLQHDDVAPSIDEGARRSKASESGADHQHCARDVGKLRRRATPALQSTMRGCGSAG
ncbi:unannotated protein [freshwater metagenome]|uniref:Unannotated protein n=1 Tax=freshwater metagenome TaxID=449393 RepID=A0A6J6IYC4_9ZZZZ